jgi:hypothetical protein
MTPYEKALQLKESFNHALTTRDCAMVCVDEIIDAIDWHEFEVPNERLNYWQQVKQEIKNL